MTTIEDRRIAANHDAPAGMAWATVTDEPIGGIPITLALQEDGEDIAVIGQATSDGTITSADGTGTTITTYVEGDWVAFIVSARGNAYYNGSHPSAGAAMTDLNRRLT